MSISLPPQSEFALLAAWCQRNAELDPEIPPAWFSCLTYRWTYRTLCEFSRASAEFDRELVVALLQQDKRPVDIALVVDLFEEPTAGTNLPWHKKQIRNTWAEKRIAELRIEIEDANRRGDDQQAKECLAEIESLNSDTIEDPGTLGQKRKVPTLKLTKSEDIVEEQLSWLWKNRFLFGHVNIIAGDPGLGKSMVAVDAAARVSRGLDWPDGSTCEMGTVIYATTEDGYADTVKPRLSAANADHSKIVFLEGIEHPDGEGPMFLDEHLAMLDWHLDKTEGVKLLVLDTLQSFIGDKVNTNNNSSSRRVMTPLKRLAEKHRVAVLAIEHMTKSKTERKDNASYRVQGSIAFIGAARSVWICCKHPDDDQKRILQASKTNLAPDGEGFGLSFGITGPTGRPYIEWDESNIETPIAELLSGDTGEADQTRATEFQRCCEYLRGYLTEAKPTNEVKAACKSEMFSEATIRRAKDHLQIGSEQRDRKWFWTPSEAMLAGQSSDAQGDEHLSQMFMDEHLNV